MTWRNVDQGTWRDAQLAIFAIAVLWGLDYWFTPAQSSSLLSRLETAMPLRLWGSLLIGAGIAGLIAEFILGDDPLYPVARRGRWGWVSNTSHSLLFGVSFALASSSLIDVLTRDGDGGTFGWRTAAVWLGFAWLNSKFVRRIEPRK